MWKNIRDLIVLALGLVRDVADALLPVFRRTPATPAKQEPASTQQSPASPAPGEDDAPPGPARKRPAGRHKNRILSAGRSEDDDELSESTREQTSEQMREIEQALDAAGSAAGAADDDEPPYDIPAAEMPRQKPPAGLDLPTGPPRPPYAYSGAAERPPQTGLIGHCLRAGESVWHNYDEPFAHGYFGPPGSGKSYAAGVHVENALCDEPRVNVLPARQCGLFLGFGKNGGGAHGVEMLHARLPNQDPREVSSLIRELGVLPRGIEDVVALTLDDRVIQLHREHTYCRTVGLKYACSELGVQGLQGFMGMNDKDDSLLSEEISDMLRTLPRNFTKADVRRAVEIYPYRNDFLRGTVRRRFRLAGPNLHDGEGLRRLVVPGRLLAATIRDNKMTAKQAMRHFEAILNILVMGEGELPCHLLLVIDEAHLFSEHKEMRLLIEHIIKERRHLKVSVILCSQYPVKVPHSTLAELDGVGLFPTGSEKVIHHLAQQFEPFSHLDPATWQHHGPSQMAYWTRRWYQPSNPGEFDGGIIRVQVRPRLSNHGGRTRSATR